MKRICFLLLSSMAFGQGVVVPTQQALKTVNGVTSPVANATITVCAANTSGIPCSPVLGSALFKDAALTQPLPNPFTSDANGNYVFAIAPGNYTVTVTAATFVGYSYQTTAPVSAAATNTFSSTNTFSGATNLNGGGSLTGTFSGPATFSGTNTFTGQLNCKAVEPTVKCVDAINSQGWSGSDIGAWVNAADTAIGTGQGELWIFSPTQTNATTQISVGDQHTVRLSGTLGINAPILIGKFGGFECPAANSNIGGTGSITATQNMANMIRMRVQDGSLVTMYINGCIFNGGGFQFSRGVIDLTGVNDRGNIGFKSTLVIAGFTGTGPGIYVDDCPNGTCVANAGSGHTEIGSVWVNPSNGGSSTAPCATFTHTNTAGSTPLGPWHITSLECQMFGDTASQAVLIQNNCTSTCGTNQWQFQSGFFAHQIEVDSSCAACDGIKIDGVFGLKIDNVYSFGGNATSNTIHVTNNANNLGIHVNDIINLSAGNAYKDDILSTTSAAKEIREFTAGPQTTGSSLWNSLDERPFWGNLVGIGTSPPGLGIGTQRYGCYGNSSLFGISCSMNGTLDVTGLGANAPVWLGTVLGHFMIDSGGAAGAEFRFLNTGESFTGLQTGRLTPGSAGGFDLGTTALPWGNLWLGTAATNNFKFQPASTTGARIITITDPVSPTTVGLPLTIASGTATMTTAAITAGNCGTTVTVAATGVATTDSIYWSFNAAPAGSNAGIVSWPTSGNVNFAYCSNTAQTPAAATINWRVVR